MNLSSYNITGVSKVDGMVANTLAFFTADSGDGGLVVDFPRATGTFLAGVVREGNGKAGDNVSISVLAGELVTVRVNAGSGDIAIGDDLVYVTGQKGVQKKAAETTVIGKAVNASKANGLVSFFLVRG